LRDLLQKALAGEKSAEEELLRILHARFLTVAGQYTGDYDATQDISQEACLVVLRKYKSEKFTVSFEAWAYGVLRMKIRKYHAGKATQPGRLSPDGSHPAATVNADNGEVLSLRKALVDCLREMNRNHPLYARVLTLNYQGYATREICKRLQMTKSNMYSTLSRGRARLRRCLEERRA
jgi:RNA polymerase sigma factor (sigma-70 family)